MKTVDIIGRGFAGLAAAYRLAQAGFRIRLIGPESTDHVASYAAVGISSLKGGNTPRTPLYEAKYAGHHNLIPWVLELQEKSGITIPHSFGQILEPFFDEKEYRHIKSRVFHKSFTGCRPVQLLDKAMLHDLHPQLSPARGAYVFPQDFWVDPEAVLRALNACLTMYHTEFINKSVAKLSCETNRINHLQFHQGESIRSEITVLAAGWESNNLLNDSGGPQDILKPFSGSTLMGTTVQHAEFAAIFGKTGLAIFGQQVRSGSNSDAGAIVQPWQQSREHMYLAEIMRITGISMTNAACHTGVRARTRRRNPLLGLASYGDGGQIWLCTGLYKNGMQLADLFAQNLVRLLTNAPVDRFIPAFFPEHLRKN